MMTPAELRRAAELLDRAQNSIALSQWATEADLSEAQEPYADLARKLREGILALALEWQFTKEQILELYLNRVYFGSGATGLEKAARVYYQKSAAELTLPEAATLAGVVKAPSAANPISDPAAAADRARLVAEFTAA